MECKLCDYFVNENHKCSFTGVYFSDDVENIISEYPCSLMSYDDYLSRNDIGSGSITTHSIKGEEWRYIYKRCHAASSDRYKKRVI
ncbi:MAG TPA: hypothetical protein VHO66_07365 [Ruminiclostridium sp.]|nr:hypothetical protein [Ruminiclostridium sp.]